MKIDKSFFSFSYYDHYAMVNRRKVFFSFSYYDHYAMINREKNVFFLLATTITTP